MRPFRLGSTSYVYADDLVGNARRLAGVVDDMELVLFESEEYGSNFPSPAVVAELNEIAQRARLTYTVHLPTDLKFGDVGSYDKAQRVIELTRDLHPFGYVMHLDGRAILENPSPETLAKWKDGARDVIEQVVNWVGDASRVCFENIEAWNPDAFATVVRELHVSR